MEKLIKKAEVLIESLPYLHNFSGKTFIIKYGGSAIEFEEAKKNIVMDVIFMKKVGINPILVHGGGKKISEVMGKMGKKSEFIDGHRVTDQETMDIVEMVLVGSLNKELVNLINVNGGNAVGISGKDGHSMKAGKHMINQSKGKKDGLDIGFVGKVEKVNASLLNILSGSGFIPVVSSVGFGDKGETYNINADTAASAIAQELNASKLILLTDVDGIYNKKGELISTLKINDAKKYIADKTIKDGMKVKIDACMSALKGGVEKTHIINASLPHGLLLEIFTQHGVGTEVIK